MRASPGYNESALTVLCCTAVPEMAGSPAVALLNSICTELLHSQLVSEARVERVYEDCADAFAYNVEARAGRYQTNVVMDVVAANLQEHVSADQKLTQSCLAVRPVGPVGASALLALADKACTPRWELPVAG